VLGLPPSVEQAPLPDGWQDGFMSDENSGTTGSDDGKGITRRVGTAERDSAIVLLDEHWQAGRLDPGEHEQRVTRARTAVTRADLDALFIDLPKAGPAQDLTGAVAHGGARGFLGSGRDTIMALTPFIAMGLFFTTGYFWMWWLLIPVMGILLYGPEGGRNLGRGRDRGRNRDGGR
jgi:Domain of unknown function (DUF1707)